MLPLGVRNWQLISPHYFIFILGRFEEIIDRGEKDLLEFPKRPLQVSFKTFFR